MVNGMELSRISWEENFGPEESRRTADLIVAAITSSLAPPAAGYKRLFFVVPTPTPYAKAEEALFAAASAAGMAERDLRLVPMPSGGKCYAISGESQFRMLIPNVFHLGPPELTFIAANCEFDLAVTQEEIANFVLRALRGASPTKTNDLVGMHFDSGDLVEMF